MNIHLFLSIQDGPDYILPKRKLDKDDQQTLFLRVEQLGIILVGKTNLDISIWMGRCRQLGEFCEERAKEREEELYLRTEQELSLGDLCIRVQENKEPARDQGKEGI